MIHQYHLKNDARFVKSVMVDNGDSTPSESGSDPGEKSDDSGYKSSTGRSRSESCPTNIKSKIPGSRTWRDNIEYKRTEVDSNRYERNNFKQRSFDEVTPCEDQSDYGSDVNMNCEEKRRKSSCKNNLKHSSCDRKTSLQNVKRVKSYIFNSVRSFVICLSLLQLFQVMGSGYSKSALTSIERRYRLSTFQIGFLQSCFHFGNLSVILFVSYYGSRWHRPRAIAIGSLLMAFSSFLSATPQFIGSRYNPVQDRVSMDTKTDILHTLTNLSLTTASPSPEFSMRTSDEKLCRHFDELDVKLQTNNEVGNLAVEIVNGVNSDETSTNDTLQSQDFKSGDYWDDSNLYLFIALGSVVKGMGHSPLHPLGMSFIDDYATPRNSAVYIGIVSGLSLLGPAFGFILGSLTTRTWVDWGWIEKVKIDPHNPMWVGAWWMGYLVTGVLLLIATVPLYVFPRIIEREKDEDTHDVSFCGIFQNCCTTNQSRLNETANHSENVPLDRSDDDLSLHEIVVEDVDCDVKYKERNQKLSHTIMNRETTPERDNKMKCANKYDHSIFENNKASGPNIQARCSVESRLDDSANSCVSRNCNVRSHIAAIRDSPIDETQIKMDTTVQHRQSCGELSKDSMRRRPSRLEKLALIDFSASFKGLLTDSVFLSITFGLVCLTSFLAASVTYVAKYMETQFSITASFANLLNGSVNLPMVVVGNLLGGWLIRRFDLNVRRTMFVVVAGIFMTIISVVALLLFKCQASTESYSSVTNSGNCPLKCDCIGVYSPVCDLSTNTTYTSPCHAGCRRVVVDGLTKIYADCRCLSSYLDANRSIFNRAEIKRSYDVVPGPCNLPDCSQSHLPVFLGVMGAASLTAGVASTPSSLLILRIVPPAEKAFAIGIVFVFTRILAWIPAPVYVGYIIDSACLRWSAFKGSSDINEAERNHCEMYDKDRLRNHFFAATIGLLGLSLLFYTLAVFRLSTRMNRKRKKRLNISRKRILSYSNSTNFSRESSPTDSLVSPERSASVSKHSVNFDRNSDEFYTLEDRKLSECLESKQLILSSALEKPFKIVISLSAPVLADQTGDDGRFCMAPPAFNSYDVQQITDV